MRIPIRGLQNRPQYTMILIIGTPKKGPLILLEAFLLDVF